MALSDRIGETEFYLKEFSSGIVFEKEAKKTRVSTVTIDSFLQQQEVERIDLINMDCEGSELLVLRGAKEAIRKNKVKIFCEIHRDFLKRLGQSIGDLVKYIQNLEFEVQSVSLDDLKVGNNFDKCDYIYAHNLDERKNYAHLRL